MKKQTKAGAGDGAAKRAYWKQRITEWARSGQSQRVFCNERGLVLSTFQWWRAKLRATESQDSAARFLPLALEAARAGGGAAIEIELRSRTRMRFEGEAALQAVAQLVARVK
jgi:hypothetical protein